MTRNVAALAALLAYSVLVLWMDEPWAWSLFQIGILALAAVMILQPGGLRLPPRAWLPLAGAAMWPALQLSLHTTVSPEQTWVAWLNWCTWLLVFVLAAQILASAETRMWFAGALSIF